MAPAAVDTWSAQGTTPEAIEEALRRLLHERHADSADFIPARALNMLVFTDSGRTQEITARLRLARRQHASRLILLSYEPGRTRLDARAEVASEAADPDSGGLALLRETVTVELGDRHMDDLRTIADPLVVTDLPTLLWSPSWNEEAVESLLDLSQMLLLDSIDEPRLPVAMDRAESFTERCHVVDLAWIRSTPWRERLAAAFDPPHLRAELAQVTDVAIRHHPESTLAGLLAIGWLASRLGWRTAPLRDGDGQLSGEARREGHSISLSLNQEPDQRVRGLASVAIETASGRLVRLDRGEGGLRAHMRDPDGRERDWVIVGASRGEDGMLADGIRITFLRDDSYATALRAARSLVW